jgi:MFS family permease
MWSSPTYASLLVVAALVLLMSYGVGAWQPLFAVEQFHMAVPVVGTRLGLISVSAGVAGQWATGLIADRLRRAFPTGRLWWLFCSTALWVALSAAAFLQPTFNQFVLWSFGAQLFAGVATPCIASTLHDLVLPRMRGVTTAIIYLATTIIGAGIGPYLVGLLSDATGDLRFSILVVFAFAVPALLVLVFAIHKLRSDESSVLTRAAAAGEILNPEPVISNHETAPLVLAEEKRA